MSDLQIKLHYRNVRSEVVGEEHGISKEQFDELSKNLTGVIEEINKEHEAGKTPYRDLPYNVRYPEQIKSMANELRGEFENFVVLGIGGSALGNIALQTALNPYMYNIDASARNGGPRLFVFDNVDPCQLGSFFDWLDSRLDKTVFNVISKSGRTAETASQFLTVRRMLIDRLGADAVKKHIVATTDANEGTLRSITDAEGYRSLEVPDGVGGRFSVLSPVGLLSGSVCGVDIDSLLEGARRMDDRVSNTDFYTNPAAVNAAINWHFSYDALCLWS
jgi:glucose-6-phosphate isomerase